LAVKNKVYNKIHTFMLCDENMLKVQRDKFKGVTVYSVLVYLCHVFIKCYDNWLLLVFNL